MTTTVVWFNQHLQGMFAHINALADTGEYNLLVSHSNRGIPSMQGDERLSRRDIAKIVEPTLAPAAYVDWCLSICKDKHVTVFIPEKEKILISKRRDEFLAIGTRVMTAGDATTLRLLDRKDRFLKIAERLVPVAPWRKFYDVPSFVEAWKSLKPFTSALCAKPVQGIYGSGFWRFSNHSTNQLFSRDTLTSAQFKSRLKTSSNATPKQSWLLMAYCDGDERSVDCATYQGKLIAAVIRRKTKTGTQLVEHNPPLLTHVEMLVQKFNLTGVINVQFKELNGEHCVLEINSRPAGGSGMAYLAGIPLMPLAMEAFLHDGVVAHIPSPAYGTRIRKTNLYYHTHHAGTGDNHEST